METLQKTYDTSGLLHHAYAIIGGETARANLRQFFAGTLRIPMQGNPDFLSLEYETFGIDEARELKERQGKRPAGVGPKIFLISAKTVTTEAQNALLKVFEEPASDTHFFLVVSHAASLIPTFLSRIILLDGRGESHDLWADFLFHDIPKRLDAVRKIIDAKDRDSAISLLNAIEEALHDAYASENISLTDYCFSVNEIGNCRGHLRGRSPSLKLVLEHIALVAPQPKKQ